MVHLIEKLAILQAGKFDYKYYLNQCISAGLTDFLSFDSLLDHYIQQGWRLGLDPSDSFHVAEYLRANPSVKDAGIEPLGQLLLCTPGGEAANWERDDCPDNDSPSLRPKPSATSQVDIGSDVTSAWEGNVDYLSEVRAIGWAWLREQKDDAVIIRVILNGTVLQSGVADQMRPELQAGGKGTGRYGFDLTFDAVQSGAVPTVEAIFGAQRWPLPVSYSEIRSGNESATTTTNPTIEASPFQIDGGVDRITPFEASGWVWAPSFPNAMLQVEAVVEGHVFGRTVADQFRKDLHEHGVGTGQYGFHMTFSETLPASAQPTFRALMAADENLACPAYTAPAALRLVKDRSNSTIDKYVCEHDRFTSRGSEFEEHDPDILNGLTEGTDKPLVIAFYLPQFHAIPENDAFWGRGFTEWRQLPRALSRFPGHYQPRIPRDLGFYNLNSADHLRAQVKLATSSGIGAFAFYYYWFNGHRVLEQPLDMFVKMDADIDFLLIWANENWTRTWDGSESAVLLRQDYRLEDEAALLAELADYFSSRRYVRIGGRPLFVIYNPGSIPDTRKTIIRWRATLSVVHSVDPLFFMCQTFGQEDPHNLGFDGAMEFPPHKLSNHLPGRKTPDAYSTTFTGRVIDYEDFMAASLEEETPEFALIKTVVPSWDNESRRPNRGLALEGSSPRKYEVWLRALIQSAMRRPVHGRPIVAINAWNEWAEGAYLEPDVHYGSAYLNATARAQVAALAYQAPSAAARPRVSVILPNYNHAAFIVERVQSVLNQSVSPSEIIFLDDCSTDDSVARARAVLEAGSVPFRIVLNEENSGCVFRQWVKGIGLAQHEIIWVAETDDSAHSDFLLHLLPEFEREEVMAAFGHIRFINPDGTPLPDLDGYFDDLRNFDWMQSGTVPAYQAFAWDFTIKNVVPNASGLLFRKPSLSQAEIERLYEYRFAGDWYFYALMLRGGCLSYCRAARSFFRLNRTSASRSAFFTDRHLREHRMVIEDLTREYGVGREAVAAHAASLARYLADRREADLETLLTEGLAVDPGQRPMRLCIAANSFDVGGGEVLPVVLANELRRLGHHITYLVVERPRYDADSKPGIRHRLRPDIPVVYWDDVKAGFGAFLRGYGIEVFNSHNVSVDYRLALLREPFLIPYVGSLHGGYETVADLFTEDLFTYLRETVSCWLYLSEKNLTILRKNVIQEQTFIQSFNAVPDYTGNWIDRANFRAEHNIPEDAFVLVLCSRAIEEKGWSLAVEMMEMMAEGGRQDVHLVLIGDGPAAVQLRTLPVAEMSHVTLLGQVDTPVRYFRCFDAAIFPSTFNGETFPLFLLECFSVGLPVVTTDIGEISKIMGEPSEQPGTTICHRLPRASMVQAFYEATLILVDNTNSDVLRDRALTRSREFSVKSMANSYVERFHSLTKCQDGRRRTI